MNDDQLRATGTDSIRLTDRSSQASAVASSPEIIASTIIELEARGVPFQQIVAYLRKQIAILADVQPLTTSAEQ